MMSTCDCGLPVGSVVNGKDAPRGACFAKTRYAEHYEQDECYRRQIENLEAKLAAALADRERIWESAYNKGWANRDYRSKGWTNVDPPNPYSHKETREEDYDDG